MGPTCCDRCIERFADGRPPVATRYGLVTKHLEFTIRRCQDWVDNNGGRIAVVQQALDGADEYAMASHAL